MTATEQALETARVAVAAAADKKANNIVVLDVSEQLVITDCFVIASAPNERQVEAIVDAVEEKLRERGVKPVRREGAREGRWVLLDFVDVVVHVQHNEERGFYGLERLWKDCPRVEFAEARVAPAVMRAHDPAPDHPAAPRADRLQRRGPDAGPSGLAADHRRPRPGRGRGPGAG